MTIYIIIALSILLISYFATCHANNSTGIVTYDSQGKLATLLCYIVLAFVSGFRYHVGTDYWQYETSYLRLTEQWFDKLLHFNEPGIAMFAKIGSMVYNKPISLFVLSSLITVFLYVNTIKKNSNEFYLSIMLYIFIGSWHGSFNAIRQYLAAAIVFSAHKYIYDRNFHKYIVCILLAMCFHRTAIIMLPIYFIASRPISLKNIAIIAASALVIRSSYDNIFSLMSFFKGTDQSVYEYMTRDVNPIRIAVSVAPVFLLAICNKEELQRNTEVSFYASLIIINATFMIAASGSTYITRIGIYTETFTALAVPKMLVNIKGKSKFIVKLCILLLYFIYWLYEINTRNAMEYHWYFSY